MKKMIKMFCTECGEELQEDVNFCPNCGTNSTLYPDKESNLNIPGSLEKFQPANKEDPLTGEVFIKNNSQDDPNMIDPSKGTDKSTTENPENWQNEKEHLERIIHQLELENQDLREKLKRTSKPLAKTTAKTRKVGDPTPHEKSADNMWNKFKKWYNE
jgi:predicted  nucleic acid-binding Zn-ribbon protein